MSRTVGVAIAYPNHNIIGRVNTIPDAPRSRVSPARDKSNSNLPEWSRTDLERIFKEEGLVHNEDDISIISTARIPPLVAMYFGFERWVKRKRHPSKIVIFLSWIKGRLRSKFSN